MKIRSIEPTPSPNTMKVNLTTELEAGTAHNYTMDNKDGAPKFVQDIFTVEGVKGVYHVADFIAIERNAKVDWKDILAHVRSLFGEENTLSDKSSIDEHFGEVKVQVQQFKGIPMQVKVTNGDEETRVALPSYFIDAVQKATKPDDNVVLLRKWKEQDARYGDLSDVAAEVAAELEASFTKERLDLLIEGANEDKSSEVEKELQNKWIKVTMEMLEHPDWKVRFSYLEQMDPSVDDLAVLEKALNDPKPSIRRLATVYLGMIEDDRVIPFLEQALEDKTVTVRRTAGDAMSDLGSVKGIPAMIRALKDKNKLVRWRAAMFLYEVGDESAIESLKEAEDDPEFEVSLQVKLALARIEGGEEAKGSVWKQMTEAFDE